MSLSKKIVRFLLVLGLVGGGWLWLSRAPAADAPQPRPALIESGFTLWTKGAAMESAFEVWQKGGMLEGDSKIASQASYLRRVSQYAGSYRSHEVMQTKFISRTSQIVYFQLNFERAAVYARFLLYRTEKDWVVQSMDFNTRPEALMPWLAFEGDRVAQ